MSINRFGEVSGYYIDVAQNSHGFERFANGTIYAPIDAPNATQTFVLGMNDAMHYGVLAGGRVTMNGRTHGFTTRSNPIQFTLFDVPGSVNTEISDLNNKGDLAGAYEDASSLTWGFVKSHGTLTPFQAFNQTTFCGGMNNNGDVVGYYIRNNQPHGFLRKADGTITHIGPAGAVWAQALGINDVGQVVGTFLGSDGAVHGFFGVPTRLLRRFDEKNGVETAVTGINNSGRMTGYYKDSQGAIHGFLTK